MAATKRNAMLIEEAREKIKTTQLINRLQNHALGEVEMSSTQVRATEVLLRKRIPDLAVLTVSGDEDNPIRHERIVRIILEDRERPGDTDCPRLPAPN